MTTYAVPALDKGLDLLEALAAQPEPRSQTDLARDLGRSPSEIFRMLACLERRGYIVKEAASGRYRLTLRLYELAHTHTPVDQLLHAAEGPMRDLARRVRESVHLSVVSDGRLLVLSQVESQNRTRVSVEIGARFPLVLTASGLGAAARDRFLADLLRIRRDGVFQGKSDLTHGIRDVAALAGNPRVGIAGAVCVPSLIAIGTPKPVAEIRAAVRECAATITRNLGLQVTLGSGNRSKSKTGTR
jgi:DNA-binding IclR family transcriptional regulator